MSSSPDARVVNPSERDAAGHVGAAVGPPVRQGQRRQPDTGTTAATTAVAAATAGNGAAASVTAAAAAAAGANLGSCFYLYRGSSVARSLFFFPGRSRRGRPVGVSGRLPVIIVIFSVDPVRTPRRRGNRIGPGQSAHPHQCANLVPGSHHADDQLHPVTSRQRRTR